jgi:hypothetical protein
MTLMDVGMPKKPLEAIEEHFRKVSYARVDERKSTH